MAHPSLRVRVLRVATTVAVAAVMYAQSPTPFAPLETGTPEATGNRPLGFGDVNGDGAPDMIVAGTPYVYVNDGHGRFSPGGGTTGVEPTQSFASYAIGDVNMDGRSDLITATSTVMTLWHGTAAGGLVQAPNAIPFVFGATSIALGDISGDGAPEIFVGVTATGGIYQPPVFSGPNVVLVNSGTGVFTIGGAFGSSSVGNRGMTFVDMENDGDNDIMTADSFGGLAFIPNIGGTFGATPSLIPSVTSRSTIRIARFNSDIYPDYVVSPPNGLPIIYLGGPTGPVASPSSVDYTTGAGCGVADITGDGIDELIDASFNVITVYSVGALGAPSIHMQLARTGGTLWVADIDQDLDKDLWLYDVGAGINSLYFNTGTGALYPQRSAYEPIWYLGGPCVLDINGDSSPDLLAISVVADTPTLVQSMSDGTGRLTWSPASVSGAAFANKTTAMCAADLDGDGDKDVVLLECVSPMSDANAINIRTLLNVSGTFVVGPSIPFTFGAYCDIVAADVNHDGIDEIVVGETVTGVRIIWTNASGGLLLPGTPVTSNPTRALAVKDMDADGDIDIIAVGTSSSLWLNSGSGVMTPDASFPNWPIANHVSAGDVNNDGQPDVYIGNRLYLHIGDTWQFLATIPTGSSSGAANEVRSFDIDGDGDIDTVTGYGLVYLTEPNGLVSTHTLRMPIGYGIELLPVDLDLDGDLDLVAQRPMMTGVTTIGYESGVLFNTSRHLTVDAPTRPGRPTHIGLRGAPNGHFWLFAAASLTDINIAPYGHLRLDLGSLILLADGPFDSAGTADTSIVLPASYSAFIGAEIAVQGFVDTVGGPKLTNARRVIISNP